MVIVVAGFSDYTVSECLRGNFGCELLNDYLTDVESVEQKHGVVHANNR